MVNMNTNRTYVATNPNAGIGSVVRGDKFRRGVITGWAAKAELPIVQFDDEPRAFAVHPARLIAEVDYLKIINR